MSIPRMGQSICEIVVSGLVIGHVSMAAAQSLVQEAPTNVPGVSVVAPPPPTFDLQGASAADLAQYAIPPRPNAVDAPAAFAKWQGAMSGLQTRDKTPRVESTNLYHGRARSLGGLKQVAETAATVSTTSSNWSGTTIVNGSFGPAEAVIGEFIVPTAKQAFGTCGGWNYSSSWPGIDGYGTSDVLQGGAEADSYCAAGSSEVLYSAWVEWFPGPSTRMSSPAISPGDLVFVEVWNTSATDGYVYFVNYSTNVSAEYHLTAPAGTTLKSNSVEWIIERPSLNGAYTTLTNYVASAWPFGIAWNYNAASPTYYRPGTDPATGTLVLLTMIDNNGGGISMPTIENGDFLWFENYGSSCGAASSPPC